MGRGLVAAALSALALMLVPTPAFADATEPSLKPYVVHGIYTREERSLLTREGFDIAAVFADRIVVVATVERAQALALRGYRVTEDAEADDFPPTDSNYHNYNEMVTDMQNVAAAHPSTVRLFSIGTSFQGRDLIAARISNDVSDNLEEPGVFFVGMHHAREHLSVEVVLSLLHLFAESNDPDVQALVASRQIYIVPNMNPDGGEYDINQGFYRFWRKNRQPTPQPGVFGTDNNRNYGYKWGCCGGSSPNPGDDTYRGPSPFSAPENARVRDFIVAHPNVMTGISYHSYGDLILYPYGYTFTDVPPDMTQRDHNIFVAIAAEMASTTGYTDQQSSDLYITDGDMLDWMYGDQKRYAFTIELGGGGFYPPDEFIPGESVKNHEAAIFVADMADCPSRAINEPCGPTTPETQFPDTVTVKKGRKLGGNAASLAADDANYFEVRSTQSGTRTSIWLGKFPAVTNALSNLRVTYKGKNAPSCTQKLAIYRFSTSSWVTLDTRTVGAETLIANLAPPGLAGDYVSGSAGDGELRVRVRCSTSSTFTASGNLLQIDFDRPA